jgi:hypothetical protein
MDFRRLSLVLATALAFAGGAEAASDGKAKKYFIPPPPKAKDIGLKGVAKPVPPTIQAVAPLRSGGSNQPVSRLALTSSTLSQGLSGLPRVGDAAPICRAQCAQDRYTCLTVDDEVCDTGWARCVAGCGP